MEFDYEDYIALLAAILLAGKGEGRFADIPQAVTVARAINKEAAKQCNGNVPALG